MEQVKRQPGTSPMQRVRSPSLWEGGGVACAFGVGTRTRTRTPPASRARGCVTDRLVRVSSRSSRQDQERRGQRAAADVAEVPAVLLAVPAEHGKRVPAGAPASPRPPAARSRPARLPRVRTRPSSRHRAGGHCSDGRPGREAAGPAVGGRGRSRQEAAVSPRAQGTAHGDRRSLGGRGPEHRGRERVTLAANITNKDGTERCEKNSTATFKEIKKGF